MNLVQALEETVEARQLGGPEYAVLIPRMRSLASVLDERPSHSVALPAWSPAMRLLLTLATDPPDPEAEAFMRHIATPSSGS
jgi:hypothetical protein